MDFRAKLGPLPVWAWGLIFGGLAVIWLWVQGRSDTPDYSQSVSGEAGSLVPSDIAFGGDFSTVPVMPVGETETISEGDTNDDWLRRAVAAVMNSGVSTLAAQRAVQKYLSGETLTTAEEGIVNKAIAETGLPPSGTSTPSLTAPSKPSTPKKPAAVDYSTVTTISAPSSSKYRRPLAVRVTVKWKNASGKTGKPTGHVVVNRDGVNRKLRLYAGQAVTAYTPKPKGKYAKDGIFIIKATYKPTGKAKSSAASPKTIRLKK